MVFTSKQAAATKMRRSAVAIAASSIVLFAVVGTPSESTATTSSDVIIVVPDIPVGPTVPTTAPPTTTTIPDTLPPYVPTTRATVAPPTVPVTTTTTSTPPSASFDDPTLAPVCESPSGLPCRIVSFYGNPTTPALGALGRGTPDEVAKLLLGYRELWAAADTSVTTRCAYELIAFTAQAAPGPSNLYRARVPAKVIDATIAAARANRCIVILDVQVGWSSIPADVPALLPWLNQPDVHLALDPEWDMQPGAPPGTRIGTTDAADINWTIRFLDEIARRTGKAKLLVVHRFRDFMVTNPRAIAPLPGVRLLVNMDGFGSPARKYASYRVAQSGMPTTLTGMKLFFRNDTPLLGPKEVLGLKPQPMFINYQ